MCEPQYMYYKEQPCIPGINMTQELFFSLTVKLDACSQASNAKRTQNYTIHDDMRLRPAEPADTHGCRCIRQANITDTST